MHAIVIKRFGGPECLVYTELPEPESLAGHVVIDTLERQGDGFIATLASGGHPAAPLIDADGRYGDQALLDFATNSASTTATQFVTAATELLDGFGDGLDDDDAIFALSVLRPQETTAVAQ